MRAITFGPNSPSQTGEAIADMAVEALKVVAHQMSAVDHAATFTTLFACLSGALAGFHGDKVAVEILEHVLKETHAAMAEDAAAATLAAETIATASGRTH